MASGRRYFGNVRQRASGRYQARYRGPDGKLRSAPVTFARRADALRWLALQEAEIKRGDWIDPDRSRVLFGDYAEQWITDRVLKVRTTDLYRALLRVTCHQHGTTLTGFLPRAWDHPVASDGTTRRVAWEVLITSGTRFLQVDRLGGFRRWDSGRLR
jgi:hypothetical protein